MINGSSDQCYNCGGNHFIKDCKKNKQGKKEINNCNRCGRKGHSEENCYANKNIDGGFINDSEEEYWGCDYCGKEFDTEKGCLFHENVHCKKKYKQDFCKRCGRSGHSKNDCYAEKHVRGYELYY